MQFLEVILIFLCGFDIKEISKKDFFEVLYNPVVTFLHFLEHNMYLHQLCLCECLICLCFVVAAKDVIVYNVLFTILESTLFMGLK